MPKRLGQHFLQNTRIIDKTIAELEIEKGDTILEIGPGQGALTLPLLKTCGKVGANMIAVELDSHLIEGLHAKIEEMRMETHISIINADILGFLQNPEHLALISSKNLKIVGNIPYYVTGHLLRMIGELKNQPKVTIIMIQEEVAERICAQPPKMNRLAASIQYWAKPKIIARAPKTDFSPPPEVDSAVIKLETLEETGRTSNYYEVMRAIFAQPRKTILNNLGDANLGSSVGDTKETKANIILKLQKLGIDPGSRPQNLTIENIRAIAEACG